MSDVPSESVSPTANDGGGVAVTRLVAGAFEELERAGLRWALLRGTGAVRVGGDIDVAVAPEHADLAETVLVRHGFVTARRWAAGSQRFLVGRDTETGSHPLVQLSSRLSFDHWYGLELPDLTGCLDRSTVTGGVRRVSDGDEFWITLLHCLLDKGGIDGRHRARLLTLQPSAAHNHGLTPVIASVLGHRIETNTLLTLVETGAWDELEELTGTIRSTWRRSDHRWVARTGRNLVSLWSRRLLEPLVARPPDIALLAPDGAGKSTVAAALALVLPRPSRVVYLGAYGAATPGWHTAAIPGLDTLVRASVLWARWVVAQVHRSRRRYVIYDRHPIELRRRGRRTWRSRLRTSLLTTVPRPTIVAIIDVPSSVLHARKAEHSLDELARMRDEYLRLAERIPGAIIVDGQQPPDAVAAELAAALWHHRLVQQ